MAITPILSQEVPYDITGSGSQFSWHGNAFRITGPFVGKIRWSLVKSRHARSVKRRNEYSFDVTLKSCRETVELLMFWAAQVTSIWCKSSIQDLRILRVFSYNGRQFAELKFERCTCWCSSTFVPKYLQGIFTTVFAIGTCLTKLFAFRISLNF